jgi:hypothetical protein
MKQKELCQRLFDLAWEINEGERYFCFVAIHPHVGNASFFVTPKGHYQEWIYNGDAYYSGHNFNQADWNKAFTALEGFLR